MTSADREPPPWEARPQPRFPHPQARPPQPFAPPAGAPYPGAMPPGGPFYGQPGFAPFPVPPARKSRVWLIVLLAVGIPVLAVVGLAGLGLAYNALADEKPANATQQELVLKAADLAPYVPGFVPNPAAEKTICRTNVDGTVEIENTYESEDMYLYSTYGKTDNATDAAASITAQSGGVSIGYSGTEVTEVERNDLFRWGDSSKFYIVRNGVDPIGNRFIARKGGKVVHVLFSGVYFDDRDSIHELLDPLLRRIEAAR